MINVTMYPSMIFSHHQARSVPQSTALKGRTSRQGIINVTTYHSIRDTPRAFMFNHLPLQIPCELSVQILHYQKSFLPVSALKPDTIIFMFCLVCTPVPHTVPQFLHSVSEHTLRNLPHKPLVLLTNNTH